MMKVTIEFRDGTKKTFDNAAVGFTGDFITVNAWKSEGDRRMNYYHFPKNDIRSIAEE